jgi:hypothetical protein
MESERPQKERARVLVMPKYTLQYVCGHSDEEEHPKARIDKIRKQAAENLCPSCWTDQHYGGDRMFRRNSGTEADKRNPAGGRAEQGFSLEASGKLLPTPMAPALLWLDWNYASELARSVLKQQSR